jgi:hypothetical protein
MDPVFTLQWPEFVVAQRLQSLLPPKEGYSILIPLSRQEKGIDLAVLHRRGNGSSGTTTVQVKASRTYIERPPKREETVRFRYNTWFNRFNVPERADFVILIGLYAPDLGRTTRVPARWYEDCSLLFTREEMRGLLAECKTRRGEPDRMFGFGFDHLSEIRLVRPRMNRSGTNFAIHLLEQKIVALKRE